MVNTLFRGLFILFFLFNITAITDLRFTAHSFTSASIEWTVPTHCSGIRFHIQIFFDNSIVYNTTSLTTSVNVTDLSQGVEYSVSVFGISDENSTIVHAMINMTIDGMYTVLCNNYMV